MSIHDYHVFGNIVAVSLLKSATVFMEASREIKIRAQKKCAKNICSAIEFKSVQAPTILEQFHIAFQALHEERKFFVCWMTNLVYKNCLFWEEMYYWIRHSTTESSKSRETITPFGKVVSVHINVILDLLLFKRLQSTMHHSNEKPPKTTRMENTSLMNVTVALLVKFQKKYLLRTGMVLKFSLTAKFQKSCFQILWLIYMLVYNQNFHFEFGST